MRTCVCNPAALKAAEELHARSKGYSTSVFCLIYINDLYNNDVGKGECGFMKLMK